MDKCKYCDDLGFCKKYSNYAVVWKCKEDPDCEGYVEGEDDKQEAYQQRQSKKHLLRPL